MRNKSKLDMMTVLLKGHSVFIFPETAWNLSPNKLHLPLNWGFIDVAKKTGVPIIPVIINYTYDTSGEKERIENIHIKYEKPMYITEIDNITEKLNLFSEIISTNRWNMIEENGRCKRKDVKNKDYINYIKGNLKRLKLANVSIDDERKGIQGSEDDFYLFHHLNDVPFSEEGEFLKT